MAGTPKCVMWGAHGDMGLMGTWNGRDPSTHDVGLMGTWRTWGPEEPATLMIWDSGSVRDLQHP